MQAFAGSSGGLAFQKFTNDRSVNVGEASLNPVMIDAQSSVIQSNQVKECGMKIMGLFQLPSLSSRRSCRIWGVDGASDMCEPRSLLELPKTQRKNCQASPSGLVPAR